MESLKELYKIGNGPSSSHTMGPAKAAEIFYKQHPDANNFRITLFGSLAATGKGHLTDIAIANALKPKCVEIIWDSDTYLPYHPNALKIEALSENASVFASETYYSVGGGKIVEDSQTKNNTYKSDVYEFANISEIMKFILKEGISFWQFAEKYEDNDFRAYLANAWNTMLDTIKRGLNAEGVLPGNLKLERKAHSFWLKAKRTKDAFQRSSFVSAFALAVAEENASGGIVVTAPTCGSAGVLPAVLEYVRTVEDISEDKIINAIATAGIFGIAAKQNASISGAEVGCQGEIGVACAMSAAAVAQLLGGTPLQIEYAAEIGLEHHLGLTCDPVRGYVQIPCIERNAFAAMRALDCTDYALLSDGRHKISFDDVVETMKKTGQDLKISYRETSKGGLASIYEKY